MCSLRPFSVEENAQTVTVLVREARNYVFRVKPHHRKTHGQRKGHHMKSENAVLRNIY
jgi:hypothetical protein